MKTFTQKLLIAIIVVSTLFLFMDAVSAWTVLDGNLSEDSIKAIGAINILISLTGITLSGVFIYTEHKNMSLNKIKITLAIGLIVVSVFTLAQASLIIDMVDHPLNFITNIVSAQKAGGVISSLAMLFSVVPLVCAGLSYNNI